MRTTFDRHGATDKLSFSLAIMTCTLLITLPTTSIALPLPTQPTSDFMAKNYVVFDDVGTMVSNLGFLHVLIPINISTLHDQAMLLAYNLHNLTVSANDSTPTATLRKVLIDIVNIQIIQLNEVISELITVDSLLPETDDAKIRPRRNKRFIFLPPLIAVGIEYDKMKRRYYNLADDYNVLKHDYDQLQEKYNLLLKDRDFYKQKYQNLTMFVRALQEKYPQDIEYPDSSTFMPVTAALTSFVNDQFKTRKMQMPKNQNNNLNLFQAQDNDLQDKFKTMRDINNLANLNFDNKDSTYPSNHPPTPPTQPTRENENFVADDPMLEVGRAKRQTLGDIADISLFAMSQYDGFLDNRNVSNATDFVQNCNNGRDKRAVGAGVIAMGAVGALGGLLGTFLGMYNVAEIKQLQNQVGNLNEQSKLLMEISLKQEKAIQDLLLSIDNVNSALQGLIVHNPSVLQARLSHHISMFKDKVRQSLHVIQELQHRRLAVDYLDKAELNAMHEALKNQAHTLGYELLPEKITDYFQLEASYLRVDQDIVLILHVPCVAPHGKLKIYKHIPYPFPIHTAPRVSNDSIAGSLMLSKNVSLAFNPPISPEALYLKSVENFIAIGTDDKYKTFTEKELTECDKHGRYFLCEGHQILRTHLAESCLGALYLRQEDGMRAHCKFERRPLEEEVYQTSSNDFLVFSPTSFTTKLVCTNASLTNTPIFVQGATNVHVPPGCTVELKSHAISADLNIRISPPPIHAVWEWNPLSFPSSMLEDIQAVDNRLAGVQQELHRIQAESSITSEVNQLHLLQLEQGRMLPWTGPVAYAAAILVIIVVAFFAYGCYRQRQNSRAQVPSLSVAYHQHPENVYMPLPGYDRANTTATYEPSAPGNVETKKNTLMCSHNKLYGVCCPKMM